MSLPTHEAAWELVRTDGSVSRWTVYIRQDWPTPGESHPFATNERQTDPCAWITDNGDTWRPVDGERVTPKEADAS